MNVRRPEPSGEIRGRRIEHTIIDDPLPARYWRESVEGWRWDLKERLSAMRQYYVTYEYEHPLTGVMVTAITESRENPDTLPAAELLKERVEAAVESAIRYMGLDPWADNARYIHNSLRNMQIPVEEVHITRGAFTVTHRAVQT